MKFFRASTNQTHSVSLERYSYIPSMNFSRNFFPVVAKDTNGNGMPAIYIPANIANAFVTTIPIYAFVRVIAGIGLAGELGAGVTLVTETMEREKRGYGTMIIVSFGALGAVVAAMVGANGQAIGNFLTSIFNITFVEHFDCRMHIAERN